MESLRQLFWLHYETSGPQIALWGAVCFAIAILAHRISRRFRNLAIGWSIAIVPKCRSA